MGQGQTVYAPADLDFVGGAMEALVATKHAGPAKPKPIMQVPWFQGSNSHCNKDLSEFVVNGHTYQKTGAEYQLMYGPAYGLIRVEGIYSLKYMAKKIGIPAERVTSSPHWSEVAWLTYSVLCKEQEEDTKEVKHIMFTEMQDLEPSSTGALLRNPAVKPPDHKWPATFAQAAVLKPGDEIFNIVLGSSSGVGVAYLLLQNRNELGQTRHLVSVRIWQPERGSVPCMVFTVSDRVKAPTS